MSRKPSFANLRSVTPAPAVSATSSPATPSNGAGEGRSRSVRAPSREGRKQIAGFFLPQMSLAMHMLAPRQDRSLESLMTKAFSDVLRKDGKSPIGE